MKLFRMSALMLALLFAICSIPAHAQQEVDPDHFDHPGTTSTLTPGPARQSFHSAVAAHGRANTKLARAQSNKTPHQQYVRLSQGRRDILGR